MRSQRADFSDPAESFRLYHSDLDLDHVDRSSDSLLHQDVLDILPDDVRLDPRGSRGQLDILKLSTAGSLLSEVWSCSPIPNTLSSRLAGERLPAANATSNQLAKRCASFCLLLSTQHIDTYGNVDLYIIAALCHQVSVYSQEAKATVQAMPSCDLYSGPQLVWHSNADKEVKARTCLELLTLMAFAAFNMCFEVKALVCSTCG